MSGIRENTLEKTCLSWLGELGWEAVHGPDIAPGTQNAERSTGFRW